MALLSLFADQAALALASVETFSRLGRVLAGRAGRSGGRPRPGPRAAPGRRARLPSADPDLAGAGRYVRRPRAPRRVRAPAGPRRAARCRGVRGEAAVTSSLRPAWSDAFATGDAAPGAADRPAHRQGLGLGRRLRGRGHRGRGRQRDRRRPPSRRYRRAGRRPALGSRRPKSRDGTEGPHDDLFGHGTACAGIIRRAAPDATLWSVRVLGSRLTGKGVVFAAGLRWAIAARGAGDQPVAEHRTRRTTSGCSTRSPTRRRSPA